MSFVKSIQLTNFKQFRNFVVSCKQLNILTGPNNAGKSSVLDALRIVSDVVRYSHRKRPGRKSFPGADVCGYYNPPQSAISIPINNISRNYSDDPALVSVVFSNGAKLHVTLHPDNPIEVFLEADGNLPATGVAFRKIIDLDLCIVPTLGPFEETEDYLRDATVDANENTRRAARNFRNIAIRMDAAKFEAYKDLVKSSWPGVQIQKPERDGTSIIMMYEEDRIPREIYWSGFGLQVWFQMLMQILRGDNNSIFVLDEPDIYLHADVQRRLLNICREKFGQLFLATHSTEIINEANPGDILMVKRGSRGAKRVSDEKSYRELFQYLGSSENAEFARLSRAKRIVFFEGKDRKILKKFSKKLGVGTCLEDPDTVFIKIGGFGQWKKVTHASWTLSELFDMDVSIAALFDSDHRSEAEIRDFLSNTDLEGVCCRVLARKEIENYCLNFSSISRFVKKNAHSNGIVVSDDEIEKVLVELTDEFEVDTVSSRTGQRITFARKNGRKDADASISKAELTEIKARWHDLNERFKLVDGKTFVRDLSQYTQRKYGFSTSVARLIDEMRLDEIDSDLIRILSEFDEALSISH